MSGDPMQRLGWSLTDGNLWQLRLRKEDPSGEIFVQLGLLGLQSGVVSVVGSGISPEHVQNASERLVLAISLGTGLVPGSLVNKTIPWRQSGHGIEPEGPWTVTALFIEQGYRAHLVQNSWSQPAPSIIELDCLNFRKCRCQERLEIKMAMSSVD